MVDRFETSAVEKALYQHWEADLSDKFPRAPWFDSRFPSYCLWVYAMGFIIQHHFHFDVRS